MPSVLVETGFISNPAEEKFLNSVQGQDYLASAIYRACNDYINEINSRSIAISNIKKDTTLAGNNTPAPVMITTGGEIAFMVQVSASSTKTEIKPENFKGLKDVYEINAEGRFKYVTGRFNEYPDALRYRKELKQKYPDAFVIAVRDNEILPLQQAINQKKIK
jgi:N-acetylmuramoyl-L-alanine amidase